MTDLLKALRVFDALRDGEAGGDLVNRRVLRSIAPTYAKDADENYLATHRARYPVETGFP